MNHIKNIWKCFEEKHSAIAKWLYQIFYFVIFSMGVTVFQYLVFTFLPGILGIGLAGTEFMLSVMNWGHFLHSVSIFRFREILLLKAMEILYIRQSGILLHG